MIDEKDFGKVLMIAATPFFSDRGCHIRIYSEIKYLNKKGIKTVLCTYHLGEDPVGIDKSKRIFNIPWYKKTSPGPSWHKIYLDSLLFFVSLFEFMKIKPKVIHAHLYEGLAIAFLIKIITFSGVKILFDCQGSLVEEMGRYSKNKKIFKFFKSPFIFLERKFLSIPDIIVCSSENLKNYLISKYSVSESKIEILNDAVDDDLSRNLPAFDRDELGIPFENFTIFYSGSIDEGKGVFDILDSIPEMIKIKNNLTFVFAGYGVGLSVYQKKLKDFIKSKNVIFLGRTNYFDLAHYLSIADYGIEPKKDSTESSAKMLGYIHAGLPIICYKTPFNFSLLGGKGIYIDNPIGIAEINFKRYKESYKEVLNWDTNISNLINFYERLS